MSEETARVMCNSCVYLEGIDVSGNYYCAIYGKVRARILCARYKGIEALKPILEQLQKQYEQILKKPESEQ